ncbi:MAG: class I SAM-dependent methyltransferase [Bacteroidales bacterium]
MMGDESRHNKEMETLSECPLCGESTPGDPFIACRDYMVSGEVFQIVRCSTCSLLYTNPRPLPDELHRYYQSEEYISHTESTKSLRDKIYHRVRREMLSRKGKLLDFLKPGKKRILDVGCGTGAFLKHMQGLGNEVYGYEPALLPREKARQKGITVIGEEQQLDQLKNLDVITLWHVLEHMPDFKQKLNQLKKMLSPEGYLVIAVPLWKSFDAAFYEEYWAAYDVPRHLFHFDQQTLIRACQEAGLHLQQTNALPFDGYYVSLLSEQYRKNPLGMIRAIIIGTWSGLLAMAGRRPWSSQIFVFRN